MPPGIVLGEACKASAPSHWRLCVSAPCLCLCLCGCVYQALVDRPEGVAAMEAIVQQAVTGASL
jgi:hypothetical protein